MLRSSNLIGFGSTTVDGGGGGNDAFTVLLMHADGADTSTTFTDSSASARTLTAAGSSQIDTAQSKFGGSSALFSASYITTADSADFAMGSGDFTIDFWVRSTSYASIRGMFGQGSTNNMIRMRSLAGGGFLAQCYNGASLVVNMSGASGTFVADTWQHVAFVRNGSSWVTYVDGSSAATATYSGAINDYAAAFNIGAADGTTYTMTGWIDEFRVSKGIARWTTGFTPPTVAYS